MASTADIAATARRRVRGGVRRIRCESRFVSRYVFNAQSVREYRRSPATQGAGSQRVLAELLGNGVAMSSVDEVLGSSDLFSALLAEGQRLRAVQDLEADPAKPYLIELLGSSPQIFPSDPLLRFALHPQIRGVAEAYSRLRLRIQDLNIWINTPTNESPTQSQRWHRDLPEDYDIVKCFVYLSDVPDGAGPLQYVKGSNTRSGRKVRLASEFDGIGHRLSDTDVRQSFGADRIVKADGPAGTIVFADTRGIHRGGFAVDTERVVLQITYASDACFRPRNLRAAPGVSPTDLAGVRLAC